MKALKESNQQTKKQSGSEIAKKSLSTIKRKYKGLIIFDFNKIDIFKEYYLKSLKNEFGVSLYFYAIPIDKFNEYIEWKKKESKDFKGGYNLDMKKNDDWYLRTTNRWNIWSKFNNPKDMAKFMQETSHGHYFESSKKGIIFDSCNN